MTKTSSKTQTVTRRRVGRDVCEWDTRQVLEGRMLREVSKIVCSIFQGVIKEGQRLMIIELENYNSAEELSIEKGNIKSLGLVQHWDTGPDSKRTMAAVRMKGKRVAMRMRYRAGCMQLPIGNEMGSGHNGPVEQKGISKRKHADRMRGTRVGTPRAQASRGGGLPTRRSGWRMVGCLSRDRSAT